MNVGNITQNEMNMNFINTVSMFCWHADALFMETFW